MTEGTQAVSLPSEAPGPDGPQHWDQPTVRLKQGELALFQSLGDPATRSACLVLYSGAEPGRRFTLPEGTLSVGRAPDCQVLLDNPAISRRHAELQVQGDEVLLRDLESVNGSWVNEQRLRGSVRLADGDMLRLGEVVLKFFQRESIHALLHDHIYRMATVDAGTEVFTRRYVMDMLAREVRLARRNGQPLSVVCIDLDHFKTVNDRWGHQAGDQVLREAAATAHAALRATDVLGRTGGEEFLAVLPHTTLPEARALAERVRAALAARTWQLQLADGREQPHNQTASFGVAALGTGVQTLRELLGAADGRLYEAKHAGRNRVAG